MRDNSKLRNAVLETLWKSSLVGLAIYDPSGGTLRDANGAFLDLLDTRYRTKKTLGTPLEQCLPEINLSGLREAFQHALASGMAVHADAVRFHRGPDQTLLVNCMLLPMGAEGPAEGAAATALLLVASERKTELPGADQLNLVDMHTRQALARQFHLSAREIDIVGECLQGKKNRQIAQDLHIGISTVKRHLESAYRKMGISSSRSLPIAILNVLR
ncbi:MAG: helix-turn-helix transcriptional regulator, partial [Terriglobales bacterium]